MPVPVFHDQPFVNPYAANMADEIAHSHDAMARAAEIVGQAQARATEAKAAAWGAAAQASGQIPGQVAAAQSALVDRRLKEQELSLTVEQRAEATRQRYVMTAGRIAGVSNSPAEFASNLDDAARQGAITADTAAHMKDKIAAVGNDPAAFRSLRQQYIDFADQYTAPMTMKPGETLGRPSVGGGFKSIASSPQIENVPGGNTVASVTPGVNGGAPTATPMFTAPKIEAINGQPMSITPTSATAIGAPVPRQEPTVAGPGSTIFMPGDKPGELKQVGVGGAQPGTIEDAVLRARREFEAANGRKPSDTELDVIDAKAMQQFAENHADPVVRATALAQKNLAIAMTRAQIDGQPTKEDAANIANDIINHRLSPDQLSMIRGRGNGALGIMIEREMKKIDPTFNWEQASSEYTLAKSPAFQQTVRYMDYVGESVGNVIAAAKKLDNGNIRSLNAVKNWTKGQLNDVDLAKFQTDRVEVADAIAKILQGGGTGAGTSDKKLEQAEGLVRASDSPAAIAASLGEIQDLIGKRRNTLTKGTYLENASSSAVSDSALRSRARDILQQNGKATDDASITLFLKNNPGIK